MPIEHWNTVEAAERSDGRRALAIAHGEGIALQHTLGGEPMFKNQPENASAQNAGPAAQYNGNAPFKDPRAPRQDGRAKKCKANGDTCNGWATSTGYCRPHST